MTDAACKSGAEVVRSCGENNKNQTYQIKAEKCSQAAEIGPEYDTIS